MQEIGDFIAHRDKREKGLITQVGRDVFTSFDVWSKPMRELPVGRDDVVRAAKANLRLATDDQIRQGLGMSRQMAAGRLKRALSKSAEGQGLSSSERDVLMYFGNRFIWRPAFTADQLIGELSTLLPRLDLIDKTDLDGVAAAGTFIALHAVTAMHGSAITLDDGSSARLFAGFAIRDHWLEVKVDIAFHELGKPLLAPICLFLTELPARAFCDPSLLSNRSPIFVDHWATPLEINDEGLLTALNG